MGATTLKHGKHLEAAAMLARDVPVAEIARQLCVTPRTILNWSKTDEAQAHIADIRESVRAATKRLAVADKVRRIIEAQEMYDGAKAVIASRREAGHAATNPLPGEATGHVAVKITEVTTDNRGIERTTVTREAAFDASIHAEARKWLEYAARELGDIEASVSVKHSGSVDHVVRRPNLSNLTDEQVEALAAIREQAIAEEATA